MTFIYLVIYEFWRKNVMRTEMERS